MSVNLVDLVMKQVGGPVPGVLGSLIGESADRTKDAVAGAVPVLLASLIGVAEQGGDAEDQLVSAVSQQDDSLLDDLTGTLGARHQAITEQGGRLLGSLLGDGTIATIVGGLGRFSGLGGGSVKSLLGLLAPIVLSVLGRAQKAEAAGGGGLVDMLRAQGDMIESAMPSELTGVLKSAGLLEGLTGKDPSSSATIGEAVDTVGGRVATAAGAGVAAAKETSGQARPSPAPAPEPTPSRVQDVTAASSPPARSSPGSWLRWAIPLLVLLVLLALIWLAFSFMSGGDVEDPVNETPNASGSAVERFEPIIV